ncbi:MAG: hypothetical protein LBK73_03510 [Treponema sp.]|jgi:hypothetical protein|nr:hypothetical protein [Treponema sp.]
MVGKLKTDLWKKSYLIEFVGENGASLDAFTFSVPPESEEITYSQRKSETKTFGGLHVDDYGLDAVKISLSGSTINQDLKKIYNPKAPGADKWMTGEHEIYYLRDLIKKYKTGDNMGKEIKIMLYDLSKISSMTAEHADNTESGAIKNYWRVFPGDFKIRRSSDRPFAYKYSVEFTAVDEGEGEYPAMPPEKKLSAAREALNKIKGFAAYLRDNKVINALKSGLEAVNNVRDYISDLYKAIKDVEDALTAYAYVLSGYVDGADNMMDTANEIIKMPGDISVRALNIGLELMNAGKRLLQSAEAVSDTILSYGTSEFWAPQEVLDEYYMTATEYADTWADLCAGLEDNANAIVSMSKSSDLPTVTVGATPDTSAEAGAGGSGSEGSGDSGGESGSQAAPRYGVVLSYGDFEVTLTSTDSLESLAAEYCGSPDRAIDIAVYNGVASIDELNPGDAIKIPMLSLSIRLSLNRIYSRPEDRDNYGRDIRLDNEGNTASSTSGDYLLTGGADNLSQAILLRLRESVNKRIRLNAYGIRTNVSDPTAGVAYIISSIDLTVGRDPRVSAVDNISFTGAGDGLDITVEYTDISHNNGSVAGRA